MTRSHEHEQSISLVSIYLFFFFFILLALLWQNVRKRSHNIFPSTRLKGINVRRWRKESFNIEMNDSPIYASTIRILHSFDLLVGDEGFKRRRTGGGSGSNAIPRIFHQTMCFQTVYLCTLWANKAQLKPNAHTRARTPTSSSELSIPSELKKWIPLFSLFVTMPLCEQEYF